MNRQRSALIDRLETSGKDYTTFLAQFSEDEIHDLPEPNEWSIHQVAVHMRDNEQQVFLYRVQRLMKETHPEVPNFDSDLWNRDHYRPDEPLEKIIADFRTARRKLVKLLRSTTAKDWENWATHPEYGRISLDWIALYDYGHTLDHLAQMVKVRESSTLNRLNR